MTAATDRRALLEALAAVHTKCLDHPIGAAWAGPTLLEAGDDEQVARWLPGIVGDDEVWCQLFSEPESGSDLASLRTRAVLDGDGYVVDGQKTWTTMADRAQWGIMLARTDSQAPKRKGLSYFVVDMAAPGIEVRPIRDLAGGHHFCEVFFTGLQLPVSHRIGAEGDGWRLATITLDNERNAVSSHGVLWGVGPRTEDLFAGRRITDPHLRQEAARLYGQALILRVLTVTAHPSVRKCIADEHGQAVVALHRDLLGAEGMLHDYRTTSDIDVWSFGYLFSRALTIGGGTSEVQRTIIAERLMGLPRDQP